MSIKFGTDGWRAVISDTFTFNNNTLTGVREDGQPSQRPKKLRNRREIRSRHYVFLPFERPIPGLAPAPEVARCETPRREHR